jgi:hypothetical protein
MESHANAHLREYWAHGFATVEGWVHRELLRPLELLGRAQAGLGVRGGALEIGVHHGKLLIALALMLREGEGAVGFDVFEDQGKNIDRSGAGSQEATRRNLAQHAAGREVALLKRDSLSLNSKDRVDLLRDYGPFRLISIDGGHTSVHALNDLLFSQDVMQSGGVIILDDFVSAHWPGVMEGAFRLFEHHAPKIAPFAWGMNKLLLTDVTFHGAFFNAFGEEFSGTPAYKAVKLWHYDVVAF